MPEQFLNRFTSNISDLYIELHDFIFRHGTYENNAEYFVGRVEIRRRLRAILTHTDTDSGTYLLAGQRGVGKTSLINKVFNELARTAKYPGLKRFFLLFAWMVGIIWVDDFILERLGASVLDTNQFRRRLIPFVILFIGCSFYIVSKTLYRKRKLYSMNKFEYGFCRLIYTFLVYIFYMAKEYLVLDRDKNQEIRIIRIFKYLGIISLVNIGSLLVLHWGASGFWHSRIFFLLLYGGGLWFASVTRYFYRQFTGLKTEGDSNEAEGFRRSLSENYKYFHAYHIALFFSFFMNTLLLVFIVFFLLLFSVFSSVQNGYVFFIIGGLLCMSGGIYALLFCWKAERSKWKITARWHAWRIFYSFLQKHYLLKRLFENKTYISIKINLGYDNLKNIDVLRLVAHNIYIEYKLYYTRGRYFWMRQIRVLVCCIFISAFLAKSITWISGKELKQEIEYVFPVRTVQEKTKVLNVAHQENALDFRLVDGSHAVESKRSSFTDRGIFCVRQFFARMNYGLSWVCVTFVNTLYDRYEKPGEDQLSKCIFWNLSVTWWLLFFFTYLIYLFVFPFWSKSSRHLLRQMSSLQDSINAQIKKEEGLPLTNVIAGDKGRFWHIGKRQEKNYPMADSHAIEKQLINIMNSGSLPRFIIVFDELDKIEMPVENACEQEENMRTDSFSPGSIRNRQQAIFKLLSGLKYFLSTVKAKFIFVAGKEMYEASLADVADRNYYLGSIFNDVIYVSSFMSDDEKGSITSQTERYVCHYLFPENCIPREYSLEEYYNYLKSIDQLEKEEWQKEKRKKGKNITENDLLIWEEEQEYRRKKIIFLLKNFILYLTHVGKGAPKKIVSLFEECVVRRQKYDIKQIQKNDKNSVWVQYLVNSKYYLKFDFFRQYTINMVTYLVNPVLLRFFNGNNTNRYGDRLLVSSLFFLDHLYKFHQYSFSWRALECSPELIDVNKSSALRDHITDILHYLSQNHLKEIDNGLYDFRFFKKTANEINFLSRISEKASAMFDFTLDETYNVIHYYEQKIRVLQKQENGQAVSNISPQGTLASFYFTLGELHLYCDEVEDAILEFNRALVLLKGMQECLEFEQIITLFKVMLCLGVTYERKNLNDQAFLVYTEIGKLLIECRNVEVEPLGLKVVKGDTIALADRSFDDKRKEPGIYIPSPGKSQELVELLQNASCLHPVVQKVLSKFTIFETLKLLHLPLLAKFQILEKIQIGGIQGRNIKRLIQEFNFLTSQISTVSKNLMIAEFYNKIGDILFYKNSSLLQESGVTDELQFTKEGCKFCSKRSKRRGDVRKPCDACCFYRFALSALLCEKDQMTEGCEKSGFWEKEIFAKIGVIRKQEAKLGIGKEYFNLLATLLSNIGDVLYSCTQKEGQGIKVKDFLQSYHEAKLKQTSKKSTVEILNDCLAKISNKNAMRLIYILSFYILSEYYYTKGSLFNMSSHQASKILMVMKDLIRASKNDVWNEVKDFVNYFAVISVQRISNSYKDITFNEWGALQHIFGKETILYKNLPLNSDAFEPVLQYYLIKLWCNLSLKNKMARKKEIEKSYLELFRWMRYDQSYGILNRINLLHLKTRYNKVLLQLCTGLNRGTILNEDVRLLPAYLLVDSINAIQEILNYSQVYGENYLLSNIFITNMYTELLFWVRLKELIVSDVVMDGNMFPQLSCLVKLLDDTKIKAKLLLRILTKKGNQDRIRKILKEKLGQTEIPVSGRIRENALRSYYKSSEMHAEGRSYKDLIERACFLNDEFNDRKFHFLMACEIYKVNRIGKDIEKRIKQVSCTIENKDSLFSPTNFFDGE